MKIFWFLSLVSIRLTLGNSLHLEGQLFHTILLVLCQEILKLKFEICWNCLNYWNWIIEICWNCLKITGSGLMDTDSGNKFSMDSLYPSSFENTAGKSLMDRNSTVSAPLSWFSSSWSAAGLEQTEEPFQSKSLIFFWNDPMAGRIHSYSKELWVLWEAAEQTSQFHWCCQSPAPLPEPFPGKPGASRCPYQGILTGLSRAGQCNLPLSGTHRSGCTWLLLPASCWILQGKKKKAQIFHIFKINSSLFTFLLGLSLLLLKFRNG